MNSILSHRGAAAAALITFAWCASAEAQAVGGRVVTGRATITQPATGSTIIQQLAPSVIINWAGFSIPPNSVTFRQPSPSAIALNRVSPILPATDTIWLINPAGGPAKTPLISVGAVQMAAVKGQIVTRSLAGDGLLRVAAPPLAVSSGQGAAIALTPQVAKWIMDHAINTTGIVEATSASVANGKIVLSGSGAAGF